MMKAKAEFGSPMLWLLAGYMWLFVHRPFEIWPWLGAIHVERAYMAFTIIYWALGVRKTWIRNPLNMAFAGLVLAVLASWCASPYAAAGEPEVEDYLKISVFYVLAVSTIRDKCDLRLLVTTFVAATALYMFHSLWEFHNGRYEYRQGIVRMIAVGMTYADPNAFGATVVCALPMVLPLWKSWRKSWQHGLLAAYVAASLSCIIWTGSRMAFCGLCALAIMGALASRYRFVILAGFLLAAPIIWNSLPVDRQNRFLTIIDPSHGPKVAQDSAQGRTQGFLDGLRLWSANPVLGVGPGGFGKAMGHGFQAHNLYGQTLSELGTCGGIALAAVILAFFANVRKAGRIAKRGLSDDDLFPYHLSLAIAAAVTLLLLMGWGGHNLFRYHWLWYGAFLVIAADCLEQEESAEEYARQTVLAPERQLEYRTAVEGGLS
jgi:O-antigen ligase